MHSRHRRFLSGRRSDTPGSACVVHVLMHPGTAEDDRVLPETKNPYFNLSKIISHFFRNPLTLNALKSIKSRKIFTISTNIETIEIPMSHQKPIRKTTSLRKKNYWSQKSASIQRRTSPPKNLENRGSRMEAPRVRWALTNQYSTESGTRASIDQRMSLSKSEAVSYTHLTLPTIYSV